MPFRSMLLAQQNRLSQRRGEEKNEAREAQVSKLIWARGRPSSQSLIFANLVSIMHISQVLQYGIEKSGTQCRCSIE